MAKTDQTLLLLSILGLHTFHIEANFDFTVRFYEYWNPTGLCAECGTNGVPVCCDDPLLTKSCKNTGVFRCDTRFRYILRPFNAPLETAPNTGFPFFTPSHTNENHETFFVGPGGIVGSPNPSTQCNISPWRGRIQLLIDAVDRFNTGNNAVMRNETEGIIDRFLIDLDQLQLGAGLTNETTYTGNHNISQLSVSFQVNCSENYYGSDCTTFCEPVGGVYNCSSDGNIICIDENRDPLRECGNIICAERNYDISSMCINCTKNYNSSDCANFCKAVEEVSSCSRDGDVICIERNKNPLTNCIEDKPQSTVALAIGLSAGVVGALIILCLISTLIFKWKMHHQRQKLANVEKRTTYTPAAGDRYSSDTGMTIVADVSISTSKMTLNISYPKTLAREACKSAVYEEVEVTQNVDEDSFCSDQYEEVPYM